MVHGFTEENVDCMTLVVLDVFEAVHVVIVRSKARTVDAALEYLTADPAYLLSQFGNFAFSHQHTPKSRLTHH
jgi:hypothetical protein